MSAWDIFGRPIPLVVTQQGKQITLDWPKEVKEEDVRHMIDLLRHVVDGLETGLTEAARKRGLS